MGLGAIESGKLEFLTEILTTIVSRENREDIPAVQLFPPLCLLDQPAIPQLLDGMANRHVPLSDWMQITLRPIAKKLISNNENYNLVFDKLEILISLGYKHHVKRTADWYWVPLGCFGYRHRNRDRVLNEIKVSLERHDDNSPFVTCGLFGDSAAQCKESIAAFEKFIGEVCIHW